MNEFELGRKNHMESIKKCHCQQTKFKSRIFICFRKIYAYTCRADPRLAPSLWETPLQSNTVSHWLGANLESALTCLKQHNRSCPIWLHFRGVPDYPMVTWNICIYYVTSAESIMRNVCVCVEATFTQKLAIRFNTGLRHYVNPVCCVATVSHQIRCMYWGHWGHFQRDISHLKWYQIVCLRYLACTFSQMKYINMFSTFLQSGVPRHYLWRFIAVWT